MKKKENKDFKYRVGADPEFTLTFRGEKVDANLIQNILFKSNSINVPGGNIGVDGCQSTGEIRPNAEFSLDKLVSNVGACLKEMASNLPVGFDMVTTSMYSPIGGHIHLNIPKGFGEMEKYKKALPALCFPIFIGENNISNAMRISNGYGSMVDSRGQGDSQEGGVKYSRFEMRGLSAEWLTSEKICRAVLAYVEMVNEELINNPKIFILSKDIMIKNNHEEGLLSSIYLTKNKLFVPIIMNRISTLVKKFKRYKDFKEEIDFILDYKKVLAEKKKFEYSIVKGWGFKQPKEIKKENISDLSGIISIGYNSDLNMSKFAESLSGEILVNNWKKNQYMIFGAREKVEQFIPFIADDSSIEFIKVDGYEEFIKDKESLKIAIEIANKMSARFRGSCEAEFNYIWNKEMTKLKTEKKRRIIIGIPREIREKSRFASLNKFVKTIESGKFKIIDQSTIVDVKETKPCAE